MWYFMNSPFLLLLQPCPLSFLISFPPHDPLQVSIPSSSAPTFSSPVLPFETLTSVPLRKSNRYHAPSAHPQHYVCDLLSSLCGFGLLSTCSSPCTSLASLDPQSYKQAACIPAWQDAMNKEFEAL